MVGMSGKSNEPRGGTTGSSVQHSKKQQSSGHGKTQPPVEALQFARILDDTAKTPSMSDLEKRIHEVLSIVPGRTSEEANVALHDNDFNVETAVSALLDNDLGLGTGEWTTTARKGKKKEGKADTDLISAPGDTKSSSNKSSRSSRGTNRAAAGSTREGYGGSVSVTTPGEGNRSTSKGGKSSGQSGGRSQEGRGRSQSGRRPTDKSKGSNPDRRREKGGDRGDGDRGGRGERGGDRGERKERGGDRGERGDRGGGYRSKGRGRQQQHNHQSQGQTFGTETDWGEVAREIPSLRRHEVVPQQQPAQQPQFGTATVMNSWGNEWAMPQTTSTTVEEKGDSSVWEDVEDEELAPTSSSTTPLFPDALPPSPHQTHPQLTTLSTAAETTPNLISVGEGSDRGFMELPAAEQGPDPVLGGVPQYKASKKPKRLARSRIPSKPVEMPGGTETSLDLEFGQLGIDFLGSEQQESRTTPTSAGPPAPISTGYTSPTDRRALYSAAEVQRITEDPSVLSVVPPVSTPSNQPLSLEMGVAQSYSLEQQTKSATGRMEETKDVPLEGPPGLTRPASVTASHETTETSPLSTSSQQQQQQQQQHALPLPVTSSVAPSAAKTLEATMAGTSGGVALQLPPDPIEMPRQQVQIQSSHTQGHYPVTSSSSDLLMSAVASTSSTVNLASSVGAASGAPTASSTHLRSGGVQTSLSSSQHSNIQQTGKPVPPGLVYPHHMMPPQYPFMPMYTPNYADPSELSRYPVSVSMAYYPPSDPTLAGHTSSTFGAADQSKFTRSTDGTSPVSSHQQSQQGTGLQQGQHLPFMNYPAAAYGFYPTMYPMAPAGFSAAAHHTLAPKPSAGASNLSNYQHHQSGAYGTYEDMLSSASTSHDQFSGAGKMYGASSSLAKSNALPTTSSQDSGLGGAGGSSASYKHNYEGSKSSSGSGGYNYGVPGNTMYGTYMGIPMHHHLPSAATQVLQGGGAHDSTGLSRGGMPSGQPLPKHNTKNLSGYSQAYWSQGHS